MIDRALLGAIVATAAAVMAWVAVAPPRRAESEGWVDTLLAPGIAGLAAARLVAVLLDDPAALARPADLLVIRGGVDFWPGVAVAVATFLWSTRREHTEAYDRLADVTPVALVALGAYESSCLIRGGCVGPSLGAGLRVDGVSATMAPVGLAVGAALVVVAVVVRRVATARPATAVAIALLGVAVVRGSAGFALPRIGPALTRAHATSLVVAALGAALLVAAVVRDRRTTPSSQSRRSATTTGSIHPPSS